MALGRLFLVWISGPFRRRKARKWHEELEKLHAVRAEKDRLREEEQKARYPDSYKDGKLVRLNGSNWLLKLEAEQGSIIAKNELEIRAAETETWRRAAR